MSERAGTPSGRRQALAQGIATLGLDPGEPATDTLMAYLDLMIKWNRVYNLTAIRDPDAMVIQHLLDSLAILPWVHGKRVLDIGSGPGLPGIPLAIARPDLRVSVLDSNHKKCAFMQQAASELHLSNVRVLCHRAEEVPSLVRADDTIGPPFDTITSRAFAELADFVAVALPLLAADGRLLAMKGVLPESEMTRLPPTVQVTASPALTVPGLDAARCAILMERVAT
jgi:16S rRNA (guanine527-N7)-methyltransferase